MRRGQFLAGVPLPCLCNFNRHAAGVGADQTVASGNQSWLPRVNAGECSTGIEPKAENRELAR